jgi:hypothetical protein
MDQEYQQVIDLINKYNTFGGHVGLALLSIVAIML